MATYNGERFLRPQLDSLARQTKLPCELMVCDDGSSDATESIVRDFERQAPFPVHFRRNERRLGHEDNFLTAASLCVGDLIAFCDQDDVWLESKLERCVRPFTLPATLLAMHSAILVDTDNRPLGARLPDIRRARTAPPLRVNPWDAAPGFSLIFSSRLLCVPWQNRPEDHMAPGRHMGHDHWVFLMASVLGQVAFVPDALSFYRRHTANTTSEMELGARRFWRDAVRAGSQTYAWLEQMAVQRAAYLDQLAVTTTSDTPQRDAHACDSSEWSERFSRGAEFYRRLSQTLALRAALHQSGASRWQRASCLARLLSRGDYYNRDHGGLGARALAKDVVSIVAKR